MRAERAIKLLFWLAGLYDGILGAAFLIAPAAVFDSFRITPPNHFGYVQFPAALLLIFALMFFAVATAPRRNRNLVPYCILLKVAYCGVVAGYWFGQGIPDLWKPFAVCDAIFALLFLWAWRRLGEMEADSPAGR